MTLKEKQFLFAQLIPKLLMKMQETHEVTFGDFWAKTGHMTNSNHYIRLAGDFNLFTKEGAYLDRTEDHKQFGEYWKSLHPLCRWGGDFSKPDGNHYSVEHEGRA
jgi:hypothetical protein